MDESIHVDRLCEEVAPGSPARGPWEPGPDALDPEEGRGRSGGVVEEEPTGRRRSGQGRDGRRRDGEPVARRRKAGAEDAGKPVGEFKLRGQAGPAPALRPSLPSRPKASRDRCGCESAVLVALRPATRTLSARPQEDARPPRPRGPTSAPRRETRGAAGGLPTSPRPRARLSLEDVGGDDGAWAHSGISVRGRPPQASPPAARRVGRASPVLPSLGPGRVVPVLGSSPAFRAPHPAEDAGGDAGAGPGSGPSSRRRLVVGRRTVSR